MSSYDELDESFESEHGSIEVRRYALKYQPPTLIVEYYDRKPRKKKVRNITFKKSVHGTDAETLAEKVVDRNSDILAPSIVSFTQLVDLIKLLLFSDVSEMPSTNEDMFAGGNFQAFKNGHNNQPLKRENFKTPIAIYEDLDLNKVPEEVNAKAKEAMDVIFDSKRLKPTDKDFEYDKRVDFGPPAETSEWDEED